MRATTHQTFGISFGLVATIIFQASQYYILLPTSLVEYMLYIGLVLFGSLLPDLDHPKSKLGRRVPFLSYPLFWFFGHRTFTHSLMFVVLIAGLGMVVTYTFNLPIFLGFAIAIGVLSHVLGDYLTRSGVPLFYPFSKKKFKTPATFVTGSFIEFVLNIVLFVLNGLLVYLNYFKGVIHV